MNFLVLMEKCVGALTKVNVDAENVFADQDLLAMHVTAQLRLLAAWVKQEKCALIMVIVDAIAAIVKTGKHRAGFKILRGP